MEQLAQDFKKIKILPEYEDMVPAVSDEDFQILKQDIKKNGLRLPITINSKGVILDGHHRYRACAELGLKIKYHVMEFPTEIEEQLFVIDANLIRRQLTKQQSGLLVLKKKPLLAKLAKQHESTTLSNNSVSRIRETLQEPTIHTDKELAKQANISTDTLYKIEQIENSGLLDDEETRKNFVSGKLSVNAAYKDALRSEDDNKPRPSLPQGTFDVILADPPWQYDVTKRGTPEDHYEVMSSDEIKSMKIPAADDAILFMWATAPQSETAHEVMKAWGFKYKTRAIWIKDKIGLGHYFRGQHEELWVGVKGNIGTPDESNRPASVFYAKRTEHSKKPDVVHSMIEQMYPRRKYLEMFARSILPERKNWTFWGDELNTKPTP